MFRLNQTAKPVNSKAISLNDVKFAVRTQARVIRALVLRETMTRYGEHKIGFLWAFFEPLLLITIVSLIFSAMGNDIAGGMPIVTFMITGFVPFTLFRDTMTQCQGAIQQNNTLMAFPQVTTFDVILARGLLEFAVLLSVFVILLLGATAFCVDTQIDKPLGVLAACLTLSVFGIGLGFALATISPLIPSTRQFVTAILGRPLFLASGLFYTAESLPPAVRDVLLWNPVLHMIELGRSAYFVQFDSQHASWAYALSWSFGSLAFGLLVHQAVRRRAIVGL